MIRIAIDGPGGAGKSSVAKAVAAKLGIIYVDTGALYRTIGMYMLRQGVDPTSAEEVSERLSDFSLDIKFENGKQVILLNGEDVGDTIRTPEVAMAASAVSAIPAVREYLLNMQRDVAARNSVIMDGRDIGTVILPNAEVKIFLTASPEARAKRRYKELIAKGQKIEYERVYAEMVERDKNDSTRDIAPCKPADDAILLDNSELDFNGSIDAVLKIVKKAMKKQKKSIYMRTHKIVAAPIRFFNRIKVSGLENVPKEGGYIVCSNHIAAKDVFLIGASFPRQLRFIAKKELFSIPIISTLLKIFGAVKIDRGGNDVGAIRKSIELLNNGELLAIFPQGHRYPGVDPRTTETKSGTALIAFRSRADILPVFIQTKNNKYRLFRKINIIIGKPIKNSDLPIGEAGHKQYQIATDFIFSKLIELGGYPALPCPTCNEEMKEEEN